MSVSDHHSSSSVHSSSYLRSAAAWNSRVFDVLSSDVHPTACFTFHANLGSARLVKVKILYENASDSGNLQSMKLFTIIAGYWTIRDNVEFRLEGMRRFQVMSTTLDISYFDPSSY